MEEVLKSLAEEGGVISSIVLLLLAFMFMFKKSIPAWINRLFNLKNKLNIEDLKHHDLFNTCIRVEKEVYLMKFYTHGKYDITKSRMCKDFTKHKINVCYRGFEKILEQDIEKMSPDEFKKYILKQQNKMHETYIDKISQDWRQRGISEEDIRYVIDLFETFRYDVVQAFEYRINSIFSTTNHHNNKRRLLAIFEMWAFGIDILPTSIHSTFQELNGRFKEIDY
tara:strand:+ start:21618 stop:22289 length:672 start_codon:yes stop_codon:yes gene_type:complete